MSSLKEEELTNILPKDGPTVEEVKKYLEKYNDEFIIIKCGGSVLVDPKLFKIFIEDVVVLNKLGFNPIIVHGGGKRINSKLSEVNIKSNFINGLRVTDKDTIEIVENVLIEFNKEIVEALNKLACKAKRITSKENNIITVIQENKDLGFVGTPTKINKALLTETIKANEVPVVAPLGSDKNSQTFNINADTAAGSIAIELKARRLMIISDVEGVLDSQKKLIPEINSKKANELIDQEVISGGMIPKIKNCLDVASNGVKAVVIIDGRKNHSLLFELLSDKGSGTLIRE
ncbi:acetylglutamate kinase [Pelagibacteraceae bacterium]|nr:acetylglutamate kinase [Candidatus Pelagibacter bacterium]MDC1253806.1 acetylglutamate kinase [Pelagibacteraceae bacterium]